MEFSIDIHSTLEGEITIEDFSREYNQYLPEEEDVVTSYDYYKYSQSTTINSIIKVGVKDMVLLDVLVHNHDVDENVDSCTFHVTEDGYYVVDHIILPTVEWYEDCVKNNQDYLEYYETIYVTDGDKIFKLTEGELKECTIKEVLERNIEGTTIKKCRVDIFHTGNLQQCYINRCKEIFNEMLNQCAPNDYDGDVYARDFIWMTLNIIDYLVGFKQFLEAERIMDVFRSCGGFCNMYQNPRHKHVGCGCT